MEVDIAIPVQEETQVGAARRASLDLARRLGFDESASGRAALVATELATNMIKHAGGGELVIGHFDFDGQTGIEMIALDNGPGMVDLEACASDGFSTAGTRGQGLGAVMRQSQSVEVLSGDRIGTAIRARLTATGRWTEASVQPDIDGLSIPKPGEWVCGDAWAARSTEFATTILVVDGLGHGEDAARAARSAVESFDRNSTRDLVEIAQILHHDLRPTRGAAIALARVDREQRVVRFVGVGNIAALVTDGQTTRRLVSHNGTAGHNARRLQEFVQPYTGGWLVLHSDGVGTRWTLADARLRNSEPALLAGTLYRDQRRGTDDATVVAMRLS